MNAAERSALSRALQQPRFEVIPLAGIEDRVAEHVPKDITVTVTVSPVKGIDHTLDVAERLLGRGYHVVPHISARLVTDGAHLTAILDRLRDLGVREVFVVGGDVDEPVGTFAGADELLAAMTGAGHDLGEIGVTGYPETHPRIEDDVTIQAMWDKRRFATRIVSQICFQPKTIDGWVHRVRRRGVDLPIHVGMPGAVDAQKLMRVAARVGVGESARFVNRHRNLALRLGRPGGFDPDRLLRRLAPTMANEDNRIAGIHVFTFNELAATERWRREALERLGA